jgi:hypothetical protein
MKVTERGASQGREVNGPVPQRFGEALRGARARARGPHRPGAAGPYGGSVQVQVLGNRRATADRATVVLRERREIFGDTERQAPSASPQPAPQPPAPARVDSTPELRALVRTLPVAVEAARVRQGEPLSLSLGPALRVDLRRGAEGLEVVLRPDAALRRAAAAELPALVAALRERGFSVARAEVQAQPNGNPAARRPAR